MPLSRSSLSFMSSKVARTCSNRSSITTLQMLHRSCDFPFSVFFFTGCCFLLLEARDYSVCSLIAAGRIKQCTETSVSHRARRGRAHIRRNSHDFFRHRNAQNAGRTRVSGPSAHHPGGREGKPGRGTDGIGRP